jgi:hypothetical protein
MLLASKVSSGTLDFYGLPWEVDTCSVQVSLGYLELEMLWVESKCVFAI